MINALLLNQALKHWHWHWHWRLSATLLAASCVTLALPTAIAAQANEPDSAVVSADKDFSNRFFYAVETGNTESVKAMLAQNRAIVHTYSPTNNTHGLSALHVAAKDGQADIMRLLIKAGANPNQRNDNILGETPLHLCADRWFQKNRLDAGHNDVLTILIAVGADVNIADMRFGNTPLHVAAYGRERINVVRLLAAGAKPNIANKNGDTPLHQVMHGSSNDDRLQILKALLAAGANPNAPNNNQSTALHSAPHYQRILPLVKVLLAAGASPAAVDAEGNTPLHVAAVKNQPQMVTALLKRMKPTEIVLHNKSGMTALDLAAKTSNHKLIGLLIRSGLKPSNSALDNAARTGDVASIVRLMQTGLQPSIDQLILLLDQGAHRAARALTAKHPQLKKALNLDANQGQLAELFPNRTGDSIGSKSYQVHALIFLGKKDEARLRLKETEQTLCGGATPLMLAVESKHLEAARVLLELGANPNAQPAKPVRARYTPAGPMSSSGISWLHYELPPPCKPFEQPEPEPLSEPKADVSGQIAIQHFQRPRTVEISLSDVQRHRTSVSPIYLRSALAISVAAHDLPMTQLLMQYGADPKQTSPVAPFDSAQMIFQKMSVEAEVKEKWQKVLGISAPYREK